MTDPFARLGAAMVRRRWIVLLVWLAILGLVGGLLAPRADAVARAGGLSDPASESSAAAQALVADFPVAAADAAVVVLRSPDRTLADAGFRAALADAASRLRATRGVRGVTAPAGADDPALVGPDGHLALLVVALAGDEGDREGAVPTLREALRGLAFEHDVTGTPAVNYDAHIRAEGDLRRAEAVSVPLLLILLLLVFRTVGAAVVPLLLGGASVVLALAALALIGSRGAISTFAINTASMIGLGLGLDFALIVTSRFRDERAAGREVPEAVARTMATAGRAITYSALTVIGAMGVLTILQARLMIVRSISLAVLLVAATALLAGLTLLPALLGILGPRIEWGRVAPRRAEAQDGRAGFWYRHARRVMGRPWHWGLAALALLALLALPLRDLRLYGSTPGMLPARTESVRGAAGIAASFGATRLAPITIVVRTAPGGVWRPEFLAGLARLSDAAAADPRAGSVLSLPVLARSAGLPSAQGAGRTPEATRALLGGTPFVARVVNLDGASDTAVISIVARDGPDTAAHQALIRDLRARIIPGVAELRGARVLVGGDAAAFLDFRDAVYDRFPLVAASVLVLIFLVLLVVFRSVFLPLKAILLTVASVLATDGALVLLFQDRRATDLLGFASLGALSIITPPILFAVLFALSTDYEVFLLARVREEYRATGDGDEAVARGLARTAGLITAAGALLIVTFGSFASGDTVTVKELGVGLALGILLDATIVRLVLVPAALRLAGAGNWWLPAWLDRLLPDLCEIPAPGGLSPAAVHAPVPPRGDQPDTTA